MLILIFFHYRDFEPGYMGIVAFGIGLASALISVIASFIYAIL